MENLNHGMDTYYFIADGKKLTPDDFVRLEQVAAIENEKMKHKIFVVYNVEDLKIFTCLN